jgi:hypothetical protein
MEDEPSDGGKDDHGYFTVMTKANNSGLFVFMLLVMIIMIFT